MPDKKVLRGDFNYLILNFIPRLVKDSHAKKKADKILVRIKNVFFFLQ